MKLLTAKQRGEHDLHDRVNNVFVVSTVQQRQISLFVLRASDRVIAVYTTVHLALEPGPRAVTGPPGHNTAVLRQCFVELS